MIYVLHIPSDIAPGKLVPGCIPSLCIDKEATMTTVHLLLSGAKEKAIEMAKSIIYSHSIDEDLVDFTEIDVRRDALGVQLEAYLLAPDMGVQVYYMPVPAIPQKRIEIF